MLILIILGGVVFFFGWAQFSVPPGKYGVVNSKTHGVDPDIIRSGEFRWIWFKLIPTNVKIAVFDLEHTKFPLQYNSALPSSDTYTSFVGVTNADFSWNLNGEISFKINPDRLVTLSQQENIVNQDDLNAYIQKTALEIENLILQELSSAGTDSERLEAIMSGKTDSQIEQLIKNRFTNIHEFAVIIHSARLPDFIMYR
jgi:hypothetical protein